MNVAIVIPNWNGFERLKKNIPEVLKIKEVREFIIVDDASNDNSVSFINSNFPSIKLIKKSKNTGFASTVNLGASKTVCELIFLLNNDATADPNCLKFILPHFHDKKVFSVGLNTGGNWSWAKFEKGFLWHYKVDGVVKKTHETLWVSGGSGVFRKDIWDKLGGLDELFDPFYEEDVDLGYRAIKRGYINLWEPRARAYHQSSKGVINANFSKNKVQKISQRNQLLFIWKNITDKKLLNNHFLTLATMLLFHPSYWWIFILAISKLPKLVKKKELEKKESLLSDEEILNRYSHYI